MSLGEAPSIAEVSFVNVQVQLGKGKDRSTHSHINVVADKDVGVDLIREAMMMSMNETREIWIVETTPGHFSTQASRPT